MTEEQVIRDEVQPSTSGTDKEGNNLLPILEHDEKVEEDGNVEDVSSDEEGYESCDEEINSFEMNINVDEELIKYAKDEQLPYLIRTWSIAWVLKIKAKSKD